MSDLTSELARMRSRTETAARLARAETAARLARAAAGHGGSDERETRR